MNPIKPILKKQPSSTISLLKNIGCVFLLALLLMLCTDFSLKAQGNGNGNGGNGNSSGGGQCTPGHPHYDPCLCGDPCNEVPLDSWVVYLVGGVVLLGFFRLKNQSFNINKTA